VYPHAQHKCFGSILSDPANLTLLSSSSSVRNYLNSWATSLLLPKFRNDLTREGDKLILTTAQSGKKYFSPRQEIEKLFLWLSVTQNFEDGCHLKSARKIALYSTQAIGHEDNESSQTISQEDESFK
jgi:hypothetical protein